MDASGRRWGGYSNNRGQIWGLSRFQGFHAALIITYWSKRSISPAIVAMGFISSTKQDLRGKMCTIHIDNWSGSVRYFGKRGFHKRLVYNKHIFMQGIILGLGVIRMSFQIYIYIYMDTDTPEPSGCHDVWKSRQWHKTGQKGFSESMVDIWTIWYRFDGLSSKFM